MYSRVFISDGSLFPKHKDNNEEHMQGDILLSYASELFQSKW